MVRRRQQIRWNDQFIRMLETKQESRALSLGHGLCQEARHKELTRCYGGSRLLTAAIATKTW